MGVRHRGKKGWTKFACVCRAYVWLPSEETARKNRERAAAEKRANREVAGTADDNNEWTEWYKANAPSDGVGAELRRWLDEEIKRSRSST